MKDLDRSFVGLGAFIGVVFFEDVDEGVLPLLYVLHGIVLGLGNLNITVISITFDSNIC